MLQVLDVQVLDVQVLDVQVLDVQVLDVQAPVISDWPILAELSRPPLA